MARKARATKKAVMTVLSISGALRTWAEEKAAIRAKNNPN